MSAVIPSKPEIKRFAVETPNLSRYSSEAALPDAKDPPRRRGNKRRGHGTYDTDRPPIVGTKGRESGLLRLRVVRHRFCDAFNTRSSVYAADFNGVYGWLARL